MNLRNPLTAGLLVVALLISLVGGVWLLNARPIARQDAQSMCTNLVAHRLDQSIGATGYDVDAAIKGYESDLLQLGFQCDSNGRLKPAKAITVTNLMVPTAIDPTCEADGKLNLPVVENATWKNVVDGTEYPAQQDAGPGTYNLRLVADEGYALTAKVEQQVEVKAKITDGSCEPPKADRYECRTSGANGLPTFMALMSGKPGQYAYGAPFTARTVIDARQSIYDQGFCDPVWMMQKYREFVEYNMTPEQANAKAHELIAQAQKGEHAQWDMILDKIMAGYDKSKIEFTTIPAGTYHSLGVQTNTDDGVPRIVDFIVDDSQPSEVMRATVTYEDGTIAVLDLRTHCDLQLRTPYKENVKLAGPAEAPRMAEIPRDREGTVRDEPSNIIETPTPQTPAPTPEPTDEPMTEPDPTPTPEPKACPPWNDGHVPTRNEDGTCPKGPDGPDRPPAASSPAPAPSELPEVTPAPEPEPAPPSVEPGDPAPAVPAPGSSPAPASPAPPTTVDPDPTAPAEGPVTPGR